ncbi:MAG: TldD/PmbA family protein [Firmicutes bacterium]|nr:TldD/PmbA family protein [Bacillota bacterium]
MKLTYPKGLYTDVRIEQFFGTSIRYTKKELTECKEREYAAAFIRVFDGNKWYYSSTSDLKSIQKEIDGLAKLATPDKNILENETVKRKSSAKDKVIMFDKNKLSAVPLSKKVALLDELHPFVQDEVIKLYALVYSDTYRVREFYNSLGANIKHDYQLCGFLVSVQMAEGERNYSGAYRKVGTEFAQLTNYKEELEKDIVEFKEFLLTSEAVQPGKYTVVFAPDPTGIFVHEIFGHKSEADSMVGDEATKAEWVLGKKMGIEELSIVDSGLDIGSGYVPYDDEGNKAQRNYIIKNGVLTGRLHDAATAADFGEAVTGNARAMNYEFEPMVRMTNTYIEGGTTSFEDMLSGIENGIYVKTVNHGSGLSTFTIAPNLSYMIEKGKITKPVRISVITGSVFDTLADIDALGTDFKIIDGAFGGCGKMGQAPLNVAYGGPSIRVRNMQVQ